MALIFSFVSAMASISFFCSATISMASHFLFFSFNSSSSLSSLHFHLSFHPLQVVGPHIKLLALLSMTCMDSSISPSIFLSWLAFSLISSMSWDILSPSVERVSRERVMEERVERRRHFVQGCTYLSKYCFVPHDSMINNLNDMIMNEMNDG